jgi:hypothetical protein
MGLLLHRRKEKYAAGVSHLQKGKIFIYSVK